MEWAKWNLDAMFSDDPNKSDMMVLAFGAGTRRNLDEAINLMVRNLDGKINADFTEKHEAYKRFRAIPFVDSYNTNLVNSCYIFANNMFDFYIKQQG